ncbi:hypothetical protein [Paenibacillus sp. FSL P4-0184]
MITTIRQPAYEMGMQAAKIMLSLHRGQGDRRADYIPLCSSFAARTIC